MSEESGRQSVAGRLMAPLNRNFGEPSGLLGRLAGWIMAHENVRANEIMVELLDIRSEDRVLEVGCGPGVALAECARRAPQGFVAGVDPSAEMVAQASRRCRAGIAAGRTEVKRASAACLPYPDATFSRILSVNAIPHWPSVEAGFAEIRRVAQPGARAVMALRKQRASGGADPHSHGVSITEIASLCALMERAGFAGMQAEDHDLGREMLVAIVASVPGS
jgi:ubiquinone/menaquinone biosynthesis C-methylase UbiE